MDQLKLFFLTAEISPFAETYKLAQFSTKVSSILHEKEEIDIRLSQPKYGFVSERKYILREVIRLRNLSVDFNQEARLINIKSSFIPETRVQVYFLEDNEFFKPLPELIYKARNGRVYSDIDQRFSFYSLAAIDTLKKLFWSPDILICNDWQTSFIPILIKAQYQFLDFYKNMKTVYIIHSINQYRKFANSIYGMMDFDINTKQKLIDNHAIAMEYSDLVILINYEKDNLLQNLKKEKKLYSLFSNTNNMIIDIPKNSSDEDWQNAAEEISTALNKIK